MAIPIWLRKRVIHDITEGGRREEKFLASEMSVTDGSSKTAKDGILILNVDSGMIVDVNQRSFSVSAGHCA